MIDIFISSELLMEHHLAKIVEPKDCVSCLKAIDESTKDIFDLEDKVRIFGGSVYQKYLTGAWKAEEVLSVVQLLFESQIQAGAVDIAVAAMNIGKIIGVPEYSLTKIDERGLYILETLSDCAAVRLLNIIDRKMSHDPFEGLYGVMSERMKMIITTLKSVQNFKNRLF